LFCSLDAPSCCNVAPGGVAASDGENPFDGCCVWRVMVERVVKVDGGAEDPLAHCSPGERKRRGSQAPRIGGVKVDSELVQQCFVFSQQRARPGQQCGDISIGNVVE
jgi:hypothetical protein